MKTVLLDRTTWDLVVDARGNIAVASDPYSKAQDASSAMALFQGELYYDTTKGVPYFEQVLGHWPPLNYVRQKLIDACMTVPGVVSAKVFFTSFVLRYLKGQAQISDDSGAVVTTSLGPRPGIGGTGSLDFSDPSNSQYLPGMN